MAHARFSEHRHGIRATIEPTLSEIRSTVTTSMLENLAARWRRRRIREVLAKADIRELAWLPATHSPLRVQDSLVHLAADRVIAPRTLAYGHWHDEHCALIRNALPSTMTYHLVDVGANVGLVSRQLLATPGLRFVGADCFEPDPESFRLLQRNLAPFEQARLHCAALAQQGGTAELYRGARNAGDFSLTPDNRLRDQQDVRTTSVALLAASDAADQILARLADTTELVWKSDTQGHDVPIVAALPLRFWQRVRVALIEVTSIASSPELRKQFLDVLAQFKRVQRVKRGVRAMSVAEVERHLEQQNASEFDVLLTR